jgi:tetratricopeptide (TPR) repeat protein
MGEKSRRYNPLVISICLVAAIIALYWPVYSYNFVKYDDGEYVTANTNIQSGLNGKSFCWAFTTGHSSNWHPITWLSLTLDYQLFKGWAGGYHLTNVLFHIANTILLFYILMRMAGAVWPSAFVAAAFALHPLHVESVAWIAERKDVLSTFFWLLTMWAYVKYAAGQTRRSAPTIWYLTAIGLFVLGLMSKPMLVTLPFVLLLLDYWPLERRFSKRLLIEKIPFFICSFASCVITYIAQQRGGTVVAIESFGPAIRINNAIVSYVTYISKMFWPSRLAVFYPHPAGSLPVMKVIICVSLLVLISICFIYLGRRRRYFMTGWLWYLGTLVPVIGLVQVGAQAMADRYAYMTLTGLFIIIAFGASEFAAKRTSASLSRQARRNSVELRDRNIVLTLLAVAALGGWAFTTSVQLKYWKDNLSLFGHTLAVTENNQLILENYANTLSELGEFDQSVEQFKKLLEIEPNSAQVYNNLGCTFLDAGRTGQAIEYFRLAIKYKPDLAQAYYNLANALRSENKSEESVSYYMQAVKIEPGYVKAWLDLAITLNELGKYDQAIEYFNKVLELNPGNVYAHGYLGLALSAVGKTDEAIKEIRFVLSVVPNDAEMYRYLGIFLEKKGQIGEAINAYRTALQINPDEKDASRLLEAALKKQESAAGK